MVLSATSQKQSQNMPARPRGQPVLDGAEQRTGAMFPLIVPRRARTTLRRQISTTIMMV
jgi:hypothetical protein